MAVTRTSDAFIPAKPAGPVRRWVSRHFATAGDSLGRLVRQPFASLMTVLVISVTLALPAAAHLVIKNVQSLSGRSEEHTSELQSREKLVCRLLLEKKTRTSSSTKSLPSF